MIKSKKNKEDIKLVFIIIFSFVIGGVVTLGLLKWTPLLSEIVGTSSTGGTLVTKNKTHVYEKNSLAPSVEKIYDATVLVNTLGSNQQEISTGTGFVYKTDDKYGYILTNNHVIKDGKTITVVMSNDEEVEAKVLGGDSYLDLAVLQIPREKVIMVANIGSSENMNLGDVVFTVGSPMGYEYRGSVTSGVLSGKDRMISVSVSSTNNDWVMRVLQIDASINPGNSGGPLFDINGNKILDTQYEALGCTNSTVKEKVTNNVLIIPSYEAIVICKDKLYGLVDSTGKELIPCALTSVYTTITSGIEDYYMIYNGETKDVIEYLDTYVKNTNTNTGTNAGTENNTDNNVTNTTEQ